MALADGAWTEPSEVVRFVLVAPTAIEQTSAAASPTKIIRDGQLLILRNGLWYDIFGKQITTK